MKLIQIVVLLLLLQHIASSNETIKIGWLPYTNALSLIKTHKPFREFMQKSLDREIEILTANSYEEFHLATIKGEYDFVVTGPHFGTIAIEQGFIPIAKYSTQLKPMFVVLKGSKIDSPKALQGKQIALSNALSVSSAGGLGWLTQLGMHEGQDYTLLFTESHPSAIHSVVIGESSAAITTMTPIKQLSAELFEQIDYFETPFALPHLFTLANPQGDKKLIAKFKKALKNFEKSDIGGAYLARTGYKSYTEITEKDIEAMQPVVKITKRAIDTYLENR